MDIDQLSALHRLHLPKIKLGLTRWMAQMRHIVIDGLLIFSIRFLPTCTPGFDKHTRFDRIL